MLIEITYNVTDVYMSTTETPVYVEISFEQPGGGAAVWGSITGTLSNQTDLQNALNAKVPYSGATGNVNLGEYGINVGNVIYDTTPTGIPTEQGATYWDTSAETVALIMNGTIQKIGEDTFYHVRNTTGSTIPKGTAVRFSGTTGNSGRLLIEPMLANGTYPSLYYMGITSEELVNNADGKVYHFGKMRNINTSAFNDGDVLYVSPSVAGGLTATAPVAPNNIIVAAAVVHANNNGTLMIRTTLGSNINADEGVLITTPTANQGLFYDGSLWVNRSISTALGYTPANAATTLTINGVTYDLSTSRTWTVAAGISGSGTSGQVTYWSGASAVSGSNNLFWDNANSRLGIGTNAPAYGLDVNGDTRIRNFIISSGSINYQSTNTNIVGFSNQFFITNSAALGYLQIQATGATGSIRFAGSAGSEYARMFSNTGNWLLQNGGTFSDGGQRLQVYGDTLLRGSGATSATTALTVQNSSSTNLFTVRNDGSVFIQSVNSAARLYMSANGDSRFEKSTSGTNGVHLYGPASAHHTLSISSFNSDNYSNGALSSLNFSGNFVSAAGATAFSYILLNGTINQTGTSTSITRGLYVNPTLTAAADFRAIEWSNNSGWGLYGAGTANNYLGGNLGIGITPTVRLQVSGDTILRGSGASSTTFSLTVQNSSSNTLLLVRNDGRVDIGAGGWLIIGESQRYLYRYASAGIFTICNNSAIGASIDLYGSTHPTNANHILLNGARVNITSASVLMTALPTSSAGLPSGALWNNGGVINIV